MSDIDKLQRTTGGGEKPAVNHSILIKIDNREITFVLKYEGTRLRYCIERKIAVSQQKNLSLSLSLSFSVYVLRMRTPESSTTASKVSVHARGVECSERECMRPRFVTQLHSSAPSQLEDGQVRPRERRDALRDDPRSPGKRARPEITRRHTHSLSPLDSSRGLPSPLSLSLSLAREFARAQLVRKTVASRIDVPVRLHGRSALSDTSRVTSAIATR